MAGLFLLAACSRNGTVQPTITASPAEQIQETATQTQLRVTPTEGYLSATAYPDAAVQGMLVEPTQVAYPTPDSLASVEAPTMMPSLYPAPGEAPSPPAEQVGMPTLAPADVGATVVSETPTPTRVIQKEMLASDPSKLQLASGKVQLIEFFAFWDGLSKAQTPMVHRLEAQYSGRVNFIYLDIDDPANDRFKQQLGYKIQPEFFLLDKRGNILKQWAGLVDETELRAAIEAAIQ